MRFGVGFIVGLVCSVVAGAFAWLGGVPEDSGAVAEQMPVLVLGPLAVAVVFGSVMAFGVERIRNALLLVALFTASGLFVARIQTNALERSCYLGTGPQPDLCAEPMSIPRHPARFAVVGSALGLVCASLGLIRAREDLGR